MFNSSTWWSLGVWSPKIWLEHSSWSSVQKFRAARRCLGLGGGVWDTQEVYTELDISDMTPTLRKPKDLLAWQGEALINLLTVFGQGTTMNDVIIWSQYARDMYKTDCLQFCTIDGHVPSCAQRERERGRELFVSVCQIRKFQVLQPCIKFDAPQFNRAPEGVDEPHAKTGELSHNWCVAVKQDFWHGRLETREKKMTENCHMIVRF